MISYTILIYLNPDIRKVIWNTVGNSISLGIFGTLITDIN
jgi:hypothetical protein